MKKNLILLYLISSTIYSQVGGESIYNFLNLTSSARQASLGGKTLTLLDDINQPNWNPSIISHTLNNQLAINYINYLADISLVSASYAYLVNRNIGTIHSNISYLNYGDFISADEEGNETGSFKAYDFSISIGYSYNFKNTDFYLGGNIKFINSVIENYSSFGMGADIGLLYYNEHKPYVVTLVVRNMGYQIKVYEEIREDLPLEISLGTSYKLENVPITWHFVLDNLQNWDIAKSNPSNETTTIDGETSEEKISVLENGIRHFSLGAELFPEKGFNLRFGYNFRRSKELFLTDKRTFAGFTAGFGIKLNKLKFNYAFSKYHPAANSSTFSLLVNLN
ncbi:type IX secretion system protein PorQ [Lutibacter sp.]|uniref:type IX secretion system protein PorQ n=1 Tax=Lutibacter sp. TaxID=1925666 RepID=UPI001A1C3FF0|nr:type IX secretion system protein PorQ [Lutibacter sp.]MBI9042514.1 type IX secretion system protein PorQ [Lutibacter sp.]